MPDKEGSDDEKTTKGVVNKKQKQMLNQEYIPEEEYDIARDQGRIRKTKGKSDATTMPVSDEVRKTQKVNTGPSALDRVLKKYGKSVMNVEKKSKKKANEELDLTKISEAFGGCVVESLNPKSDENLRRLIKRIQDPSIKPSDVDREIRTAKADAQTKTDKDKATVQKVLKGVEKKAEKRITAPKRGEKAAARKLISRGTPPGGVGPTEKDPFKKTSDSIKQSPEFKDPIANIELGAIGKKGEQIRREIERETGTKIRDYGEIPFTVTPGNEPKLTKDKPRRGRPIGSKSGPRGDRAERDPKIASMTSGQKERNIRQIKKDIDSRSPTIDTEVGKVPYRNRRVSKIRSLAPQYDQTPDIMKPDTDELLKFKDFRKKTKTTTMGIDKEQDFKAPEIPKPTVYVPPEKENKKTKDQKPQTDSGDGKVPPGRAKVTTSGGAESGGGNSIVNLARKAAKNPALSFLTFDTIRKYLPSNSPFGVQGGRAGTRSAAR